MRTAGSPTSSPTSRCRWGSRSCHLKSAWPRPWSNPAIWCSCTATASTSGATPPETASDEAGSAPSSTRPQALPRARSPPFSERCSPPGRARCGTTRRCWHCTCWPTTSASRRCRGLAGDVAQPRDVVVDHRADQLLEADLRLPAEDATGLRRIAHERHGLDAPRELRVDAHAAFRIDARLHEGDVHQLAHRPPHAAGQHVVLRLVVAQRHHGAAHQVGGRGPVAPRIQVAERELPPEPKLDLPPPHRPPPRDESLGP